MALNLTEAVGEVEIILNSRHKKQIKGIFFLKYSSPPFAIRIETQVLTHFSRLC